MNDLTQRPTLTDAPPLLTYDARELMQGVSQICLVLDDQTYFLRITRAGKLILTK